jgi:glycosyltransferase involved in cell wall biosynthesis
MHLIFIQKSTDRGGAKRSLIESLTAMRNEGSIQASALVGSDGLFTASCDAIGIPHLAADLPEWRKFFERLKFSGAMKKAAERLTEPRPDWIISNEMWWAPHAAKIAKHLGCRSAVILRDGIATIPKARQYRLFQNDLILPVSSTIGNALTPDPVFHDRVHVLFNSVRVPAGIASQAAELNEKLQAFPTVRRWMLVVGKVCPRKNQADAVKIVRSLIDDGHPDLGLLLAGDVDPNYAAEMEAVICAAGLTHQVAMIGNFDGLHALLERSDTVLLPSFREGLPRSLVEAIVAGKPAFSYPCEGVEDIFGTHRDFFVSTDSTPTALQSVIRKAWSAPETTADIFTEVRRDALERFSPGAHLNRLRSLLTAPARTQTR